MAERQFSREVRVAIQCVLAIAAALSIAENCRAEPKAAKTAESSDAKADQAATEPKWRSDILKNLDAFRALFKPGTTGSSIGEVVQWECRAALPDSKSSKWEDGRVAQLDEAIQKYPDSPYADDAALLRWRAVFLYRDDADKAIAGLYRVAKEYPDGDWIAEDAVVLDDIATFAIHLGEGQLKANTGPLVTRTVYMDYITDHPNRTADEARYWAAWIIIQARLQPRYPEAEKLLRAIIDRYRNAGRIQADLAAGERRKNDRIKFFLMRTEMAASRLLIDLLRREGRNAAAVEAADEYARLYEGHRTVEWRQREVQDLRTPMKQPSDSK